MKPQIAVVATRTLAEQIRPILPAYSAHADFRILEKSLDDALHVLQDWYKAGQLQGIVAAGATAQALKSGLLIPVAQIRVGGFDIMQALIAARRLGERIHIITRIDLGEDFAAMRPFLNLSIEQHPYRTAEDAELLLSRLSGVSGSVVVGSSLIVQLASVYGLPGVLVYSEFAIRQAIENVIESVEITQTEAVKREQLSQVLDSLSEGVIAVDEAEQVIALNAPSARFIGVEADRIKGKTLSVLAPELGLRDVLSDGMVRRDEIITFRGRTVVMNRLPLLESGKPSGALLSFHESSRIDEAGRRLRRANQTKQFRARWQIEDIVGHCPAMSLAKSLSFRFAQSDSGVLIQGESGTGKELFAQGIHRASSRSDGPFVALNCAALPESLLESELFGYEDGAFTGTKRGGKPGLIELADRGTLFLDEIGDMPVSLQTRLLRVLQEREVIRLGSTEPSPVNIRVVAATHVNLETALHDGRFRPDLYYRLNILRLQLPPLRERAGDIQAIARHCLVKAADRSVDQRDIDRLLSWLLANSQGYHWPGNVRELENLCERLVTCFALDRELQSDMLYAMLPELVKRARPIEVNNSVEAVIAQCNGDLNQAASELGISRTTLWRRRRKTS